MANDFSRRFIFERDAIRGEIVSIESAYATILNQKVYPEPVAAFLGKTLLANILLCTTLKFDGQITMQLQQEAGPISMLVAKCDNHLNIRGVARFDEETDDSELATSLGGGKLVITTQLNSRTDFTQSIVNLDQGTIAQVMEHFFAQSEQIPTRLWFACHQEKAVGLLLQKMPDASDESEEKWQEISMLTDTITDNELLSLEVGDILHRLYHEHDVRLFEEKPINFKCRCDQTKMEGAILTAGYEEAKRILKEFPTIIVTCEYCQNHYGFTPADIEAIFSKH